MKVLSLLLAVGIAVVAVPATTAAHAATGQPTLIAHYGFEAGAVAGGFAEDAGRGAPLTIRGANGGTVTAVGGSGGSRGIAFPSLCRTGTGTTCPRAILERPDHDSLDPGAATIRFGASMLLRPEQTSGGENVMQKGAWDSSSQWKLQVDGAAGHPSCAMRGTAARRIYLAVATVSISNGVWHHVYCERSGTALRIFVDGVNRGQTTIPAGLSVRNAAPMRVGGKNRQQTNDQYHGTLDNVFVMVGT